MLASSGEMTPPCGVPASVSHHPGFQPLAYQLQYPSIRDSLFHQFDQCVSIDPVKVALNVRIDDEIAAPVARFTDRFQRLAVGMAQGPAAGLHALDALAAEPALADYHLLPSVRADLLAKLGRYAEAREELQRALAMTENRREQDLLTAKLNQRPLNDRSN